MVYKPLRTLKCAAHELKCAECRVTWRSWLQRLIGLPAGMSPKADNSSNDQDES